MKNELNYLSEKIEQVEHELNLCEFGIGVGCHTEEDKEELLNEKQLLENILSKLTEIELMN